MFEDLEFPPKNSSLGNYSRTNLFLEKVHQQVNWRRIEEIYPKAVLFNKISPNNIVQGYLGNCYLLSAFSALAKFPELVKKLFYTKETRSDGRYRVEIIHNGSWTTFEIDDYFPCLGTSLAFTSSRPQDSIIELWAVFLEKVWAKRFGGYFNIESGDTSAVLKDLTGAPYEKISTSSPDLWSIIESSLKKKFIIVSSLETSTSVINSIGLNSLHAYSIIDAKVFNQDRVLLIRNPWGGLEFSGDWSCESEKWTQEARNKLRWEDKANTFYMGLEDFTKYFESITFCMASEKYQYTGINTSEKCFRVRVYSQGVTYFCVDQREDITTRIVVANSKGYVCGKSDYGKHMWISIDCECEDYFVCVEKNSGPYEFSVYAAKNADIQEIADTGILQKMWNCDYVKTTSASKIEVQGLNVFKAEKVGLNGREAREGMIIDIFENTRETDKILVKLKINNLKNIEILGDTSFILDPGKSYTVISKQQDLLSEFSIDLRFKLKIIPSIL